MATRIQLRRDTAANFTSANPTLAAGELAYETDTRKIKAGDGSTAWTSLSYIVDPAQSAAISDVHQDLSPELAAALNANNQHITAVNNFTGNDVTANTFTSNGQFTLGGHILPDANAVHDIGSADYKIRHLFLSDNSLYIGDHAIRSESSGGLANAKRDRSGGDPHVHLANQPSGTGAGVNRTFTTATDANAIANASAIFSSMSAGDLFNFVHKSDDGTMFGMWRLVSYTAGTSGSAGSTIVCKAVEYNKASNDNISGAIFSSVSGTTDLVVEKVTKLVATGAQDNVTFPANVVIASGKTLSIGDNNLTVSGGKLQVDGVDIEPSTALATVATTGAYSDITGTPSLATVATTGAYADVTGTPTLATVATSGSYNDLSNKPTSFADLTITGNLVVQGTKTELSTTTLDVEDKNITMSKGSSSASASNGAGITVEGPGTAASLIYNDNPEKWVFNKTPYFGANRLLTDADLGGGAGLDADTLDGQHGSHYLDYSNFTNTPAATTKADLDVDHIITLSGVAAASDDLGTFSGSTIADNETIKGALQDLETSLETKSATSSLATVATSGAYGDLSGTPTIPTAASLEVDHLITLSGVSGSSDNLGTFTGSTVADNVTVKAAIQALETKVEAVDAEASIANVVEDTTPQLGGNLDVQDFTLSSSGSGFIQLHDNTVIDGTLLANSTVTVNGNATFTKNVAITGQLTVNGSNTIINATTVSVDDPIIMLGGDTAPSSDDNKDRGVVMRYHTGSAADIAFMGWDDSEGKFRMMKGATVTGEVLAGDNADLMVGGVTASGTVNANAIEVQGTALATVATSGSYADLSNKPAAVDGTTVDNLVTLSGMAGNSANMGTFSGSLISDNVTIKTALQELEEGTEARAPFEVFTSANLVTAANGTHAVLQNFSGSTIGDASLIYDAFQDLETAVETKLDASSIPTKATLDVDHLITLSGVSDASDHLGTFTGSTITDNQTIKAAIQLLETEIEQSYRVNTSANFTMAGNITFNANVGFQDGVSYLTPPKWTTTQRDNGSAPAGQVIYNTTSNRLQVSNGSIWMEMADAGGATTFQSTVQVDGDFTAGAGIIMSASAPTVTASNNELKLKYTADSITNCMGMSSRENIYFAIDNNNNTTNGCLGIRFNADIGATAGVSDMDFAFTELDANEFKFKPKDARGHIQHSAWTTTERDNATQWGAGAVIWNSTTSKLQVYDGSAWVDLH